MTLLGRFAVKLKSALLVAAGAFPTSGKSVVVDQATGLQRGSPWSVLECAGCIKRVVVDGGVGMVLTELGMSRLSATVLKAPRAVCAPRPELAISDRTTFELIMNLKGLGWECGSRMALAWRSLPLA